MLCILGYSAVLHHTIINQDTNQLPNTIHYTDIAPSDFENLIKYMYLGEMCFKSVEELCFGLCAAKRFKLDVVRVECLKRLKRHLAYNHANAVKLIDYDTKFAIRCDNEELFTRAEDIIKNDYRNIMKSDEISHISRESIKYLLSMQTYQHVDEIEVFNALLKWTTALCIKNNRDVNSEELQNIAGDLVYCIRYNLIPVEKLNTVVSTSGLLNNNILLRAYQSVAGASVDTVFNRVSRQVCYIDNNILL